MAKENIYNNTDGMTKEEYTQLISYLTRWELPMNMSDRKRKSIRNKARSFEVIGGILYKKANSSFKRRKVIQQNEILQVLKENHDHLLAGHQGVIRTFDSIIEKYYWSGYFDTIR